MNKYTVIVGGVGYKLTAKDYVGDRGKITFFDNEGDIVAEFRPDRVDGILFVDVETE